MSTLATSRKAIAQNSAAAIADIVRDAHRRTGCRVDVDVREIEVTGFGERQPSYDYTVEVALNEQHTGRA